VEPVDALEGGRTQWDGGSCRGFGPDGVACMGGKVDEGCS